MTRSEAIQREASWLKTQADISATVKRYGAMATQSAPPSYDPAARLGAAKGIPVTRTTSMHPFWVEEERLGTPHTGDWYKKRKASYEAATNSAQREEDKAALDSVHRWAEHFGGAGVRDVLKAAFYSQAFHPSILHAIRRVGPHVADPQSKPPKLRSLTMPPEQAAQQLMDLCSEAFGKEGPRLAKVMSVAIEHAPGSLNDKTTMVRLLHSLFEQYAGHFRLPAPPEHTKTSTVAGQHGGPPDKPFTSRSALLYRHSANK
jgi:hypothetical protein